MTFSLVIEHVEVSSNYQVFPDCAHGTASSILSTDIIKYFII